MIHSLITAELLKCFFPDILINNFGAMVMLLVFSFLGPNFWYMRFSSYGRFYAKVHVFETITFDFGTPSHTQQVADLLNQYIFRKYIPWFMFISF